MSSLRLVVILALMLSAIGCGGNSSPSSPSVTPSPTPTQGSEASSVVIPVGAESLGNAAYSPDSLSIAVGSTVTWRNTDSVAHTTTSNGNAFDSGSVRAGGQFSFTFQNAGTFAYHCTIHPGMIGTVVVR